MLSKSFNGRISISIPETARHSAASAFCRTQNVEMKIAKKHTRLPAQVFPPVYGMCRFPKIFPARLASPSPNASARIPAAAAFCYHNNALKKIPMTSVKGPSTNFPLSRARAAMSVMSEISGIEIPRSARIWQRV